MSRPEERHSVVGRLSWIPRTPSKLPIEETRFFKEMLFNELDKGAYNLDIYRFINAIMPLYLPGRYYSMDCIALHSNSKKGNYWAYASQQLVHNQVLGLTFIKIGLKPNDNEYDLSSVPSVELSKLVLAAENLKSGPFFKETSELCDNAAEFLLNPWVLIQLPWFPIMMHQWLAAVLAEVLKYDKEIAEFQHWPVAEVMMPTISQLFKVRDRLVGALYRGFLSLRTQYYWCPEIELEELLIMGVLDRVVLYAVPYLRFLLSSNAMRVIKSLKIMLWAQERGKGPHHPISRLNFQDAKLDQLSYMYNLKFWQSDSKADDIFGKMSEYENMPLNVEDLVNEEFIENMVPASWSIFPEWNARMERVYLNVDWDAVKTFVEEEILKKGILGGEVLHSGRVKSSDILDLVPGSMMLAHYYYVYKENNLFAEEGVRKADHGVVFDVLTLNCEAKKASAIAAMTSHLHYLYFKKTTYGLPLNPPNVSGIKKLMKLTEIKTVLKNLCNESDNGTLKLASLRRQLLPRHDAKKQVGVDEKCPDLQKLSAAKVALQLELRIKKIVVKMIDCFYASLRGPKKFYEELHFVQFILPCFVASFLDMHKDSKISRATVAWYLKFVHELIKSFEVKENEDTAVDTLFASFCCSFLILSKSIPISIMWKSEMIQFGIGKAITPTFDPENIDANSLPSLLKEKGLDVLTSLYNCKDMVTKGLDQMNLCSSIMGNWSYQLHKYLCRIMDVLRNTAPAGIMDSSRLVDGAITCQMMLNYINHFNTADRIFPQVVILMDQANAKVRQRCGLKMQPNFKGSLAFVNSRKALIESKILSAEHLLGIILHYCVVARKRNQIEDACSFRHGNFFIHDPTETAFVSFVSKDWVKMKLLLSWMLGGDANSLDKSVVPFEFAKYVAPVSYNFALGCINNKRLTMDEPAQMTIMPLIHCRWCGLVDGELFMCKECKQIDNYPDKNWFCSEMCEQRALDKVHREEHARDLTIRIGFEDRVVKLVD